MAAPTTRVRGRLCASIFRQRRPAGEGHVAADTGHGSTVDIGGVCSGPSRTPMTLERVCGTRKSIAHAHTLPPNRCAHGWIEREHSNDAADVPSDSAPIVRRTILSLPTLAPSQILERRWRQVTIQALSHDPLRNYRYPEVRGVAPQRRRRMLSSSRRVRALRRALRSKGRP
jgi:hypothetical protein